MKYLKIFENSLNSILNIIEEYNKFYKFIKPFVIERYDTWSIRERGSKAKYDDILITKINNMDDFIMVKFSAFKGNKFVEESYINFFEKDDLFIQLNANKYNL